MSDYSHIQKEDPEVFGALDGEEKREANGLELIPSENYVSRAVREANGSILTNKYSEGYPGARYYGGQEFTDEVETLAIERAKKLFGAEYANVQPHSGASANMAVYFALMQPGDTILGMDLSHGGHLTHGHPVTHLSKIFNFVRYGMKNIETGEIDYDALRALALTHKPKILLAGYSAYPRELDYEKFVAIAREVGALAVMDAAHIAGLIAGKAVKNPLEYGFDVMTATTHKTLRGPRGGLILVREDADIAKKIDKAVFPGLQGGPLMNTIAGKAVCFREAMAPSFEMYAKQTIQNSKAMADVFLADGARLITGGTENHLVLLDVVTSYGVGGGEAEKLLDSAGITVNKNTIPDDTRKPMDPSGIRFGTPALTTRGFTEEACREVASLMISFLKNRDEATVTSVWEKIQALAKSHPIPESFI